MSRENYTIGWICALPLEFTAAIAMLDERHPSLPQDRLDDNAYEFGRIGSYNIIIACLPSGVYGVTSAAIVATQMRRSFPDLIAALMVGIAGGAPEPPQRDIRLGDVVVSEPIAGFGGVLQYDFGKTEQEGRFVQTGVLNKPPKIFLAAIAKLKSDYLLQQNNRSGANSQNNNANIGDIIANSLTNGTVPQEFARPPNDSDRLFQANYDHPSKNASCGQCDSRMVVKRASRPHDRLYIHYGLIASGNQVMKHGITRDCLAREKNVLCFEMEAAGVMDELPSLVIRGICDYSDSHKNKVWQPYAALSAAAFAKELLLRLPFRADERNQPENYVLNLPIAEGAAYRSYADQHKPECLAGTRVDILDIIANWIEDPQGKSIFWLVGRAGTGKSTVSRTLAKNLYTHNRLAASFFFNREEEDRRTSIRFFTTIATQLANHYSCIASKIQKAIQVDPDISTKALKEQFDKLILQPLSGTQLTTHRARLVLVIDALDECEEKESIKIIIYLLGQLKDIKTVDVRVFLTSRPDLPILLTFKKLPDDTYEDIALHEVPRIEHDISLFLQHELCKIREEREELSLPEKWPGEENLEKLVRRAMPLFIYAATLCRFIGDEQWDPDEQIEIVLNYRANWQTSQLHMTYLPVLNQLIIGQNPAQKRRLIEEFRQIVGTIVNLATPMSASSLARLLSLPERTVNCRLRPLQSVLDIPKNSDNPIRTFHLSFRDFLLDRSLQEKNLFWVDESKSHELIATKCIDLMSDSAGPGLRMNICNLPSLGILRREIDGEVVEKHIPPELRYACRYWVYHLVKSGHRLIDNGQTHQFLLKHLLHWLEVTSLLNIKSEALRAVDNLRSIIDVENGAGICGLIHDMKRFVLQNQDIIHKAPLQIYASALIFAPTRSIVRTIFDPKKIVQLPHVRNEWGAVLQTLEGHEDWVNSVAFSPDGKVLASASGDKAVKLWDTATGALLQTLEGHKKWANSVAFSPDGKVLASASNDKAVKLWDTATGALLQTLEGHKRGVNSVAFSPDGKILASASYDETVRLWDTATRALLQTLEGHKDQVNCIAFSSDSKLLASASMDKTVKLWNITIGALLQTLEGYKYWVNSVAFSPDGKLLASASHDKTVRLWDTATGVLLQTLEGHKYWVNSVAFSPDGKVLASASRDKTVRLWDTATGALLETLEGHTDQVNCIAFSPDGKLLASASRDKTIKLWDTATRALLQTLEGHKRGVNSVTFSPDGKVLASVSMDKTVRLWDTATGALLQTLEGHTDQVNCIAFSPDGKLLASASRDKTVRLWDTTIGALLQTLKGHKYWVNSVAFSPDGKVLASASIDETVRLWDTATKALLQTLEGHKRGVNSVTFSPDGRVLASASYDRTVRLWDTATRALLQTLEGHKDWVNYIAFSPDGKLLASASMDKTVRLWDTAIGALLQTLEGHKYWVNSVAFSPDGKVLASASIGEAVKLWDTATGAPLQTLEGHKDWDNDFTFSLNCKYIDTDSEPLYQITLSSKGTKNPNQAEARSYETILVQGEWLVRNGERLIWLPHDYRPSCSAVNGSTIALGHDSGVVSFITF